MAHFAEINENNIVLRVIVAEQDFINTGALGDPSRWIQTSYNTYGGVHAMGGTPLRKNYAGADMIYDLQRDAFYWPKPENSGSWVFDEQTCQWQRPVPMPSTPEPWCWNETQQAWFKTDDPTLVGKWVI